MTPKPIAQNTLYCGDNLPILREYVPAESIDLVYLDPPFNSKRTYNVLFKDESGTESEAQIAAFDDTWPSRTASSSSGGPCPWSAPAPRAGRATAGAAKRAPIGASTA